MLLLAGLAGLAISSAWGMYGTFKDAVADRHEAETQLASLQADEARVSADVDSFNSPEGLEAQVRERFGVALPGEGEIQVVRPETDGAVQPAPPENPLLRIFHALFVW
jgi:cell division protein FtsB